MLDSRRKHIVHIVTSLENGGAQEVLKTVCADTSLDHSHTVFYMTGVNAYKASDDSLAVAKSLNVTGLISFIRAVSYLSRLLKSAPSSLCVQGWMYQGNFLALLVKVVSPRTPIIFSIHNGSDHREFTSLSGFLASRVCGLFSSVAKLTIFVSKKSLACHVPYKNSIVIPNPIKPLKRVGDGLESHADFLTSDITLACVARFDPIKNIGFMLDVIQHLSARGLKIRLVMAGEGMSPQNAELVAMLQARGLENQVELLGVVSNIAAVYAQADYTILTSKCESFSNVLLESIACGTPFISSDVGIAEDLMSPESVVIEGYDISDWVDKLQKVLQIRKTPRVSQSVRQHFDAISETYAPMRIAGLYADCWAKALVQ